MFRTIKNLLEGRSPQWEKVRKTHLKSNPDCAACGKVGKGNEVHHVIPFNLDPSKELDPANLLTLCERHHLVFGHFDNFANYNRNVVYSAHLHKTDKTSNCRPLNKHSMNVAILEERGILATKGSAEWINPDKVMKTALKLFSKVKNSH